MPRSPTSSEEEMAQSFSDSSQDRSSHSSRDETVYETIRAERLSHMTEVQSSSLSVRVLIPDLQQTKCMSFDPSATVWAAKQQILCTLSQNLKDVLNYGLFQPSGGGSDGQFLDEESLIGEYPLPACEGVPSLEFRYKTRLYNQPSVDEKQIARLHTKASLRKFIDYIQHDQLEKFSRMLDRGLDPNYQDPETGGTAGTDPRASELTTLTVLPLTIFTLTSL